MASEKGAVMKKTKTKTESKNKIEKPDTEKKITKPQSKFGVLGKDLSSQFSARGDRAWRPTKPGGRNGQGKPS